MDQSLFTPYDEITQTKELQILKTIIPYVDKSKQRQICFVVQYLQMLNSMKMITSSPALNCSSDDNIIDKRMSLFNSLKKYCTESEQDTIENLLNVLSLIDQGGI